MKRLEQLPEIANQALGGLTAGQHLKLRIEKAVANPAPAPRHARARAWVPALCCALALVICSAVFLPGLHPSSGEGLITTQAAGQGDVGNERSLLDLGNNTVRITAGTNPGFRSLWSQGEGGNFPLIGVRGQYYRMLTVPESLDASHLGDSLGSVEEYTTEPALSGTDVILSNAAAQGSEVYAVDGMDGTLVAAQVNGVYRVFQRVSFNGSALTGRETLSDTLEIAGHIAAMELSGVGAITDSETCETLFNTLTENASYESSGTVSAKQSLLIQLDSGLTLQLAVKNDKLSACGTWSCPEFLEAFEAALQ